MSVVYSKAPLRLSLGGGGTDLPSYYRRFGGFVIAGAIDKYVYMLTHTVFQKRFRMKYSEIEEVEAVEEIRHPILREALRAHWRGNPVEIASVADVPSGTGMGSSGAFAVCLLKGISYAQGVSMAPGKLAEDACTIEIDILEEPVGKQDQYVAAHGGVCSYEFLPSGSVEVEPLVLAPQVLRSLRERLLLFYTGLSRSASAVLADQDRRSRDDDNTMLNNLHRTKEMGLTSRDLLLKGDLESYAELMDEHWQHKRKRSPGMSNPRVDQLYERARESGAIGGKLVGAGGGGFLVIYARRPDETREAMAEAGAEELVFDFEFGGAYAGSVS